MRTELFIDSYHDSRYRKEQKWQNGFINVIDFDDYVDKEDGSNLDSLYIYTSNSSVAE